MLILRIEKLKFIVEEMHLAFLMATHVPDPFVARTLARHILIRAENLIEHARGLRRPLQTDGYNIKLFHRTKEVYAGSFDEYFRTKAIPFLVWLSLLPSFSHIFQQLV